MQLKLFRLMFISIYTGTPYCYRWMLLWGLLLTGPIPQPIAINSRNGMGMYLFGCSHVGGTRPELAPVYTYYLSNAPHPGSLSPRRPAQQVIDVKADTTC